MGIVKKIFTEREWWRHVPDQSVFATGASGEKTQNAAARSTAGDSIIAYLASPTTVSIHLSKITSSETIHAKWVNPENGEELDIGRFANSGEQAFTTPQGWSDAVLLLRSDKSRLLQGK
jgi:hypothetical protein